MVALSLIAVLCATAYLLHLRHKSRTLSATNHSRADGAERDLVRRLVRYGLPKERIFHNLFIEKANGEYSQFDAVALTDVGVIVFEVKSYSGEIEGDGHENTWRQRLAGGTKCHQFYNPVFQNDGHIATLRKAHSGLKGIPIFSVVVFYGDCSFRSLRNIPDRCRIIKPNKLSVTLNEILTANPKIGYSNRDAIVGVLRKGAANGENSRIVEAHRRTVEQRFNHRRRTTYPLWPRIKRLISRLCR